MNARKQCPLPSQGILEAARASLRKSASMVVRAVSCDYDQGVLVLRGRVPSYYCKQLAQETVAHVPGVTEVANAIEVESAR
jgi:osmotically-inducible protein OsmY